MHLRRNQFIANIKRLGLGVAVAATAVVGQANAQVAVNISDSAAPIAIPNIGVQTRLTDLPVIQQVNRYNVDKNGNLNGQITSASASAPTLSVFLMQNKRIVQRVTTNSSGDFTLANVAPGRYSIIAAGSNQLGAQGIMVQRIGSETTNDFFTLATVKTEYKGVQELVASTLPKQIANQIPSSVMHQVSANLTDIQVASQTRIVNGKLRGQVASLVKESNVENVQIHLLKNNKPVAQVETDAMGSFTIPDAEPGVYDLVAAGPAGFAAMRVEAIGKSNPMTQVSFSKSISSFLNVPLAEDCPCGQAVDQPIDYDNSAVAMEAASQAPIEYASEAMGCGGACGGCGGCAGNFSNLGGRVLGSRGGGGGLLGGGGLGANAGGLSRLLTLGSIAGTIVAIADDDDAAPSSPTGL
jgi:hypothetical protein